MSGSLHIRVWFGLLAPPLAWAVQLLAPYTFEEAACNRPDADLWGVGIDPLLAGTIAGCAAVALAGAVASLVTLRAPEPPGDRGRIRFMASVGTIGGAVFLFGIVLGAVALLPLEGCRAA
jgi:hypothetical protein